MATNDKQPIVAFTIDFETGGLDCKECACTQIAVHAVRIDTFETIDKYVSYIRPYDRQDGKWEKKRKVLKTKYEMEEKRPMLYQDRALEYSAISMDTLYEKGADIADVAVDICEFIKRNTLSSGRTTKPFFIGQNVGFDIGFMQQLMEYGGKMDEFSKLMRGHKDFYGNFWPVYIDTIVLGQFALSHLPDVTSYKLEILAERLGIDLDDAHDADADVTATTGVAMVCTRRMRNTEEGGGIGMAKKEKTRDHFKI